MRRIAFVAMLLTASPLAASDAVEDVLELFDTADVVMLGERHWSALDARFRIELVSHPDFARRAGLVIVEFGNSLYQDVLDRYLLELEPVAGAQLALVWRNTRTTSGVWDSPLYEQFFRTVRVVNESRSREERVRVIAAAAPVDWDRVHVWEDLLPYGHRGWWFTRQIEREAVSAGRKALVILGMGHFLRKDREMEEDYNVIRRLEGLHPDKVFAVVVPFAATDGSPARIARVLPGVKGPVYIDAAQDPFGDWAAEDFFHDAIGPVREVVDGLIYYGDVLDETVGPEDGFYERNPAYAKELERRRALKPRLPGSYN